MFTKAKEQTANKDDIKIPHDILVKILQFMDSLLVAKIACVNTIFKAAVEQSWKYHANLPPEEIKKISENPYKFAVVLSNANRRAEKKRKRLEITERFIAQLRVINGYYNVDYALSHFTELTEKSPVYFEALYKKLFPISVSVCSLDSDFVQASFEDTYLFEVLEQNKIDPDTQYLLNNLFQLETEHKDNYTCAFKFLFSHKDYLDYILSNIKKYQHVQEGQYGDDYVDENTLTLCIHFFARIKLELVTLDDVKNFISNMKNKDINKLNDYIPDNLRLVTRRRSQCSSCAPS